LIPEDLYLMEDGPERDLYRPLVYLWAAIGPRWILSPHDMAHAPGYRVTPYSAAALCSEGGGPYGLVLYSRLRPRCPACRTKAGMPRVEDVEPRWRDASA
jgi:hypothetical protein